MYRRGFVVSAASSLIAGCSSVSVSTGDTSDETEKKPIDATLREVETGEYPVRIGDVGTDTDMAGGEVSGVAENTGDERIKTLNVSVDVYDESGVRIEESGDVIYDVDPGEQVLFEVRVPAEFDEYRIRVASAWT